MNGSAAGLTQVPVAVARRRLHLHVNVRRSRALTRRIDRAEARGAFTTARQLSRWRARYDARFRACDVAAGNGAIPPAARRALGRDDLAVAAYHLGIGRLEAAVRSYGGEADPTYAQLYFGSAPDVHRGAWSLLARGGDYYWKVLAAKRVLRLYRHDRAALAFEQRQQWRKNSAEEVLHPAYRTPRFASPKAIAACVAAACAARDPARRAPDAHRDRPVVRGPGAQARALAAALPRGCARRRSTCCSTSAGASTSSRARRKPLDSHERAARQPLSAGADARERERGAHVLDPHDRATRSTSPARTRARGRRRRSSSSSTAWSPRTRSRTSGRRGRSTSPWPRTRGGSSLSSHGRAEPIR